MRILHCTHSIDCGGLQRQLSYLAPEQAKRGHEVHVAYLHGGFFAKKLSNTGVRLHHIKNITDWNREIPIKFSLLDLRVPWQMFFLIKKIKPDIIQTWFKEMDIPVGLIAARKKIPWVIREPNSYRKWTSTISNLLRKFIGKKAQAIVSNSGSGDKYWEMSGFVGKRHVIRNALPYEKILSSSTKISTSEIIPGENFILYAGRLMQKGKNILTLIKGLAQFLHNNNDIKALICGDGPYRSKVIQEIQKHKIADKLILRSFIDDKHLWALMRKAKAFVFPSLIEGCPNAVLEAMACGCPLVVSDISEHKEFLDESMAWFVDPNSPEAIAQGIKRVLANPNQAQKKAHLAQLKAKNWQSIAKMAKDYEKVYREIKEKNS